MRISQDHIVILAAHHKALELSIHELAEMDGKCTQVVQVESYATVISRTYDVQVTHIDFRGVEFTHERLHGEEHERLAWEQILYSTHGRYLDILRRSLPLATYATV